MLKQVFFVFVTFGLACNGNSEKNKTPREIPIQWRYLVFEFNDTTIELQQSRDTLYLTTSQEASKKYKLDSVVKGSLFKQANNLIDFSEQPRVFCADYISTFEVRIRYNSQLVKEISFTSICDWRELDTSTMQIDQLLKTVFAGR